MRAHPFQHLSTQRMRVSVAIAFVFEEKSDAMLKLNSISLFLSCLVNAKLLVNA